MNIVTGSAGGLGKALYEEFKKNKKDVFGIDIRDSEYTDLQIDFNNLNSLNTIVKNVKFKLSSISFCHAIGNSIKEIKKYDEETFRFVNAESNYILLKLLLDNYNFKGSAVFTSSIHSQLTNSQSSNYALSKVYLEGLYKKMCLDENFKDIKMILLRLGAMNTSMLLQNVDDVDKLKESLPSKKIIEPNIVAKFIFDFHEIYKNDFNCSILNIDNGASFQLSTD
jgi:short-subunit dehydrogenase